MRLRRADPTERESITGLLDSNDLPTEDLADVVLFVAIECGERIGCGGLEPHGSDALLRSVVIEQTARGQGYGTLLVQQLLERAKCWGIANVYLLTTTAPTFFATLGFHAIERGKAPAPIQETSELTEVCPASAVCMHTQL